MKAKKPSFSNIHIREIVGIFQDENANLYSLNQILKSPEKVKSKSSWFREISIGTRI